MATSLHRLTTRLALRALAAGRAPAWLKPQLREMRRVVIGKPRNPGPGRR
ncbi:MAG: hypothetical protein JO369_01295 [Paucibacter sp.]|nr:hypothetical protein [Roseateles sp.]